jgi:hypothetical protein
MRIGMTLLALSLAIGAGACGSKKDKEGKGSGSSVGSSVGSATGSESGSGSNTTMTGSGSGLGSGSSVAATGPDAGAGPGADTGLAGTHHTGNCPSTVLGATTTAELKGGTVLLTVTSDDKDAVVAIQRRTEELIKDKDAQMAGVGSTAAHDQHGTHGGAVGICPVHLIEGAKATWKREPKGVSVTITTKDLVAAKALKVDIDGRILKAVDWVKENVKPGDKGNEGGVGGGSGKDGSNHSGSGDGKGKERKGSGTGGGGGKGTGGGGGSGK